jgi:hypothetical protein
MHRHITNQIGNISILMAVFCLILGAIAFKTGLVDNFLTALNNGGAITRHKVELLQKTKEITEKNDRSRQEDQIHVEDILSGVDTHHPGTVPELKSKKAGMSSKTKDAEQKKLDSERVSLAMTEVFRETDTREFSSGDRESGVNQKDKIDAGELYQAYLDAWKELE